MNTRRGKSRIRKSTDADLMAIRSWLLDQDARNISDSFLCNWELIQEGHKKGKLLVYFDGESKQPIAFRLGGLLAPGILEVRHDMRGKGIGRELVRYLIARHRRRDEYILVVQCKPSSSVPFWKRMGFTLFKRNGRENYAYQILKKKHRLPSSGEPIKVAVRFFTEDLENDMSRCPPITPTAVQTSDGTIHLAERIVFFPGLYSDCDTAIEIKIGGRVVLHDRAKYRPAQMMGVQRCDRGFFIDCLYPN